MNPPRATLLPLPQGALWPPYRGGHRHPQPVSAGLGAWQRQWCGAHVPTVLSARFWVYASRKARSASLGLLPEPSWSPGHGGRASVPSRHCLPSPKVLAETTRPHHQPPSALLSFPSGGLRRPAYASCSFPCPTHFLSICRTLVALGTPSTCAALATRVLGLSHKPSPGPCLPSWARGQSWV